MTVNDTFQQVISGTKIFKFEWQPLKIISSCQKHANLQPKIFNFFQFKTSIRFRFCKTNKKKS